MHSSRAYGGKTPEYSSVPSSQKRGCSRGTLLCLIALVGCGVAAVIALFATGTLGGENTSSNNSSSNSVGRPAGSPTSTTRIPTPAPTARAQATPRLEFQPDPTNSSILAFHILQVADIHLGEGQDTLWGPLQDLQTWYVLDTVINAEKPDLIVLSGDQLTGNNVDANATAYYQALGDHLNRHSIPWAMIFGNHDDADLEKDGSNGTLLTFPAKTSRKELLESQQKFHLSLSQQGPADVTGVTNYWLDIYLPDQTVGAKIVLFDSGGGAIEQQIDQSQIDWFLQTQPQQSASSPSIPVVAFQHIPSTVQQFEFNNGECSGLQEDGVAPLQFDAGIVETLKAAGNVHFLAVGHNHGNDYCCQHNNSTLHLCFGRHSGYGGYGSWAKGVRVYRLEVDAASGQFLGWSSYVRMENGQIVDAYLPSI